MSELSRELNGLKNDRMRYEIELNSCQQKYSDLLKNEMGKDINDVLNGKVKVKLLFKERLKYFIDNIFNKI